ncbi:hypothetical protein ACTFIU_010033 [Dictyostelium citrinum]
MKFYKVSTTKSNIKKKKTTTKETPVARSVATYFRDPYSHLFTLSHQLLKIICHKLVNTDESKPEPKFEVIETELYLIETEKFITLKKIKHDEAILKNTNQDLHKCKFNKA